MSFATMKTRLMSGFAALTVLVTLSSAASASLIEYTHLTPNSAETVLLSDLASGEVPGVVVGDKAFDTFAYSATGDMPLASRVNVSGILDADGNYGIRFQGSFLDLLDIGTQQASDASISFDVFVTEEGLAEGWRIHDAHLFGSGTGNFDLAGPGSFVTVDENFAGNDPATSQGMSVFASNFGQGGSQLEDWVDFDNLYTRLRVQKDIAAYSAGTGQLPARLTIIDQTFSQVQVPEPASAVLLLGSLLGSAVAMRYKLG